MDIFEGKYRHKPKEYEVKVEENVSEWNARLEAEGDLIIVAE